MGSYTFRWEHPADVVYVTGTFDDWSGNTHKLDKEGTVHSKTIDLPPITDKILYKFVADGEWKHDPTHNTEADSTGNLNNVVIASDMMPATINSSGPGATTNALAGEVPLEEKAEQVPGAFPETPAALDSKNEQTFSVNPIPESAGAGNPIQLAPGEAVPAPSTINANTITSGVHDDPELKSKAEAEEPTFSVAPIPATAGTGNPITLAPGEPVPPPESLTTSTLTSNVKLDQESYEKGDAAAVASFPNSASTIDRDAATAAAGGLGTTNIIPESSIGMGSDAPTGVPDVGPTIQSVGTTSTTNDLAGQQPIQPRQEATVIDEDKEGSKSSGIAGAVAGGVAGLGAAAAGTALYLNEKAKQTTGVDPVSNLPQSVQSSIDDMNKNATTTTAVPAEVTASQKEAHVPPEAAANAEAVQEKSAVEKELLSKVPAAETSTSTAATGVPAEVLASQQKAHVDAEAAANPEAVHEKTDVEKELLAKVPTSQAAGEPAPTATAATTATAPTTTAATTATPSTTAATTTPAAPVEHVGIAPNVSSHGAPQLGAVGPIAPITLDDKPTDSADVSPLTSPAAAGSQTPAAATAASDERPTTSATARGKNSTPNKRQSIIERLKGTPESSSKTSSPAPETEGSEKKKKGLFTRIKEKLQK